MKKVILIKYGELTTKKDNRNFFIKTLRNNIKEKLSSFDIEIKDDYYRMFIYTNEDNFDIVIEKLKEVFGIYEIVITDYIKDKNVETIKSLALDIMKNSDFKTFKVETNRSDKAFSIHSMDLSRMIGAHILKNIENISVDVHNPDITLNIEIRNEGIYISRDKIKCLGGFPVSTLGKGLLMLSGGIDSPVAGYLTMKRGVKLNYLYFESRPHTSIEARNKVINLARKLEKYNTNGKLYVISFTKIQEAIYKNLDTTYLITIMRRMMYRIAEKIAIRHNCHCIINGESIGQVASQTLTSMKAVNEVTSYPIIRPLSSFDKLDIIKISKDIDTYDISVLPYEDCCTVFVPKHPVINPNIPHIKEEEAKIDFDALIKEAIDNVEMIDLKETKSDLL